MNISTMPATTTTASTPVRGNSTNLKRPQPSSATKKSTTNNNNATTLQIKKRPYRRTKRPKNYCDKSTVTTVTTPTRQDESPENPDGTNVYDAVLGECEDLLRASTEAQRLGRLKMASAYQLLLHTRLVGLGKRFDRSSMMVDQQKAREQQQQQQQQHLKQHLKQQQQEQPPLSQKQLDLDSQGATSNPLAENVGNVSLQELSSTPGEATAPATPADGEEGEEVPAALQQLKSILPGNLEMDASMMEHLARAAVELHHQRTGRKKSADGLLASPLSGGLVAQVNAEAESSSSKPKKSSVAWTPSETNIVVKALKEGKDNYTIASTLLPSKTVAQVHAFVKNQQQLHKVNKLTQRQQQQQAGKAAPVVAPAPVVSSSEKTPAAAKPPLVANPVQTPRRGGRGRKPPTTAMNTVPNVTMDVRALLRKAKPDEQPKIDIQGS